MIKIKVGDICKQLIGANGENPIVTITKIKYEADIYFIYHQHKGTNCFDTYFSCRSEDEVDRVFRLIESYKKIIKPYPIVAFLEALK
jgi:hypothetical protein